MLQLQDQLPRQTFNSIKQCLRACGKVLKKQKIYFYRTSTHIVLPDNKPYALLRDPSTNKAKLLNLDVAEDFQLYKEVTKC